MIFMLFPVALKSLIDAHSLLKYNIPADRGVMQNTFKFDETEK